MEDGSAWLTTADKEWEVGSFLRSWI